MISFQHAVIPGNFLTVNRKIWYNFSGITLQRYERFSTGNSRLCCSEVDPYQLDADLDPTRKKYQIFKNFFSLKNFNAPKNNLFSLYEVNIYVR